MKKISIAIDGPAGAGKSSVSKILCAKLGYTYLDTGAMYRAVTYEALLHKNLEKSAVVQLTNSLSMRLFPGKDGMHVEVNGEDVTEYLRTEDVSRHVSEIAAIPEVRTAMVKIQREHAKQGGVVLDGRDIGTTVLPHADIKFFLTASVHDRALRRFKDMQASGSSMTLKDVENNVKERDHMDSTRAVSPLKKADDAVEIDNSHLTLDETAEKMIRICEEKYPGFDR